MHEKEFMGSPVAAVTFSVEEVIQTFSRLNDLIYKLMTTCKMFS